MAKPVLISGIQPSGRLHVGNYLGAIKNFVNLQNSKKYDCLFFLADLHSLTAEPVTAKIKKEQIIDLARSYIAAGLDPQKSILFAQSSVPEHTELAWVLNTVSPIGELERMTQFKDKSDKSPDNINVGLFTYPVLMAADILLYDAAVVPVGDDQDQHLELARTLARKFNSRYSNIFKEPKELHTETPRVMALDNPEKKMSKSSPAGCLFLDDSPNEMHKKIMRATTDSENSIRLDWEKKPGISNLLTIAAALADKKVPELEQKFRNSGYGDFKKSVADIVISSLSGFQARKKKVSAKTAQSILLKGGKDAGKRAAKKLDSVYKHIGLR